MGLLTDETISMDLRALADFVLVATHQGFSPASRASGQSKATLSRRIRELEQQLGFRLFDRDTRALRLTDEGLTLFERTRGPLSEIGEAQLALQAAGDTPRGRLRISAPVLFSEVALGGIAASYAKIYPDVRLELVADDRMASPVEEGFDILLRINPQPTDELVGRCFYREHLQLVTTRSVAEVASKRSGVLPSVALIGREDACWRLVGGDQVEHDSVIHASSLLMAYQAILAGAGAGVLPSFMVADDIAAGRLLKLGDVANTAVEIWALYPSRRLNSRKVTSFLDHLTATFPDGAWPVGQLSRLSWR